MEVIRIEKELTPEDVRKFNEIKPVIIEVQNTKQLNKYLLRELDSDNKIRIVNLAKGIEQSDSLYSPNIMADIIEHFDSIEKGINPEWNDLEKATYYYIHLLGRLKYSRELEGKYNIQTLEALPAGVVDSFGLATIYQEGMNRLGIPCRQLGNETNSWNEIMIHGEYYPLDLGADSYYHHEQTAGKGIGVCNFLTDKEFYFKPDHSTTMLPKEDLKKIRALDPKLIEETILKISGVSELVKKVEERPKINLKSKELKGLFKGDVVSRETTEKIDRIKVAISDTDFEALKSDLTQVGKFYPEIFGRIELANTTTKHIDMQDVVDKIYSIRKGYVNSIRRDAPLDITISSSNAEDFNLDFSNAPVIQNPLEINERPHSKQVVRFENTSGLPVKLPSLKGHFSKNITGVSFSGFDLDNLSSIPLDDVREIEIKSHNTRNLRNLSTITEPISLKIDGIPNTELYDFLTNSYGPSSTIFNIEINNQNLHDKPIFELLSRNPNLVGIYLKNCMLNNVTGIERFNNSTSDSLDRLAELKLYRNSLPLEEYRKLMEYFNNNPNVRVFESGKNTFYSGLPNLSNESFDFIKKWYYEVFGTYINDNSDALDNLVSHSFGLPYYIDDASLVRGSLNIKNSPMMIKDVSQLETFDFDSPLVNDGTLLLTIPQVERLISLGKRIPQDVRIKIESVADLSGERATELYDALRNQGVKLSGVQIFDKNSDNRENQIEPISLSDYKYVRDTLDMIVSGIDLNEPDIDRFMTVYTRISDSIIYDVPATEENDKNGFIYSAKVQHNTRNLVNGLMHGKCVCAGYSDILRNALSLVNIECRRNGGSTRIIGGGGHAWNQVLLDDGNGTKKWYYADPTWDCTKGNRGNSGIEYALRGKSFIRDGHESTYTKNIEQCADNDYDRSLVLAAYHRAKQRSFDFITADKTPIVIPDDPNIPLQIDEDYIKQEYEKKLKDMYAKFYGNKEYQYEYKVRFERFRSHEIDTSYGGVSYKTVEDYPEYEEDAKFLLLEGYKDMLERTSRYEAGDTSVYGGTQEEITNMYNADKQYVETRNDTMNSSPYSNNPFQRLAARRKYFFGKQNREDKEFSDMRRLWSIDSTLPDVKHTFGNSVRAGLRALFKVKEGNEAILRAGAQDIIGNLRRQVEATTIINTLQARIAAFEAQIADLQTKLNDRPYVKNAKDVRAAITSKTNEVQRLRRDLNNYISRGVESSIQTDAIVNESKQNARNYQYDDPNIGDVPTSRRSYKQRNDEPEI